LIQLSIAHKDCQYQWINCQKTPFIQRWGVYC
jgi:hypothetical protein